ncbi:MAG: PA0069 family radical SAM protein [Planctomycetota bacterium]|nr:PA0069 family radical SAM protein [Planctomycetota bacterium]
MSDPSGPASSVEGTFLGPARGRGAGLNPASRFETVRLSIAGEFRDHLAASPDSASEACEGEPSAAAAGSTYPKFQTRVEPDATREILNFVDSPDLPFSWTINPYRGCEHGCIYCYARPGHEYFGLSCGMDFEARIFAKHEAPALLRAALLKPKWQGEPVVFSGVTDCYQPVERELRITRACLEVCVEFRQPVSIITKNALIERDIDLLSDLARDGAAFAAISLTTLDNKLASIMEPRTSSPQARLKAIERLASAGIPVTVMTAPIIPGINDRELPALLKAASEAGATSAGWVLLRLPYQLKPLFLEWLQRHFPDRAKRVESLIRQTRKGELYNAKFGTRGRGEGPLADQIRGVFKTFAKRHGLDTPRKPHSSAAFLARRAELEAMRAVLDAQRQEAKAREGTLWG